MSADKRGNEKDSDKDVSSKVSSGWWAQPWSHNSLQERGRYLSLCAAHFNAWKVGRPSLPWAPGFLRTLRPSNLPPPLGMHWSLTTKHRSQLDSMNTQYTPDKEKAPLTHSLSFLYASKGSEAPKVTGPISQVRKELIPCLEPRQPSAPVLRPGFPLQPLIRHFKNLEMTSILPETILHGWWRKNV